MDSMNNFSGTVFFKHMLLDKYVSKNDGNSIYNVITYFQTFLETYMNKKEVSCNDINLTFDNTKAINMIERKDRLLYLIDEKKLILSGFQEYNTEQHAINILIDNDKVYIVNSGLGLNYHGHEVSGKYPVIIEFTNINNVQIETLMKHHNFCNYSKDERVKILSKISKEHDLFSDDIYEIDQMIILKKYNPHNVNIDYFYKGIFKFLGNTFTPLSLNHIF